MSYRHNADFTCVRIRELLRKINGVRHRLKMRQTVSCILLCASLCAPGSMAYGQSRVDLEDLSVKGEILNDNRLRMSSREITRIQDRVKYRKNFRPEIIDGSDIRVPASEVLADVEAKFDEAEAK